MPWLTVEQLADYLQLSQATIYDLARRKSLPAAKVGRQWRFDKDAVDMWLRMQASEKERG